MAISPAPTYDEFIALYPPFAGTDKAIIDAQLALSEKLLCGLAWDTFYTNAVGLDAAHNLYLQQLACQGSQGAAQGTAGPATSVSAAGVSISFAQPNWNEKSKRENWYMKTIYGQQLLQLWEAVMPMGMLTA